MTTPQLGNLFLLLELDPDIESALTIGAAIDRKRALWSKALDDRSAFHLLRITEMRSALTDDASRAVYRQHALEERARQSAAAQERLKGLVQTLGKSLREGGTAIPAEIVRIVEAVKPIPAAEVRAAIQAAGIKLAEPGARPDAALKVNSARIDELLDLLGKRDLYDMLSLEPSAPLQKLLERADQEYARVNPKPTRNTEKFLVLKLVGEARVVFKTESQRKAYDDHLVDLKLAALDSHIELLGRRDRSLTADQVEVLKANGVALGADPRAVEDYLLRYGEAQDILVFGRANAPRRGLPVRLFCAHCGTESRTEADTHCRQCGHGLRRDCPACRRPVYAMDMACTSCGFLVADAAWLEAGMARARDATAAGDLEAATRLLREVLAKVPSHEPALKALATVAALDRQVAGARMEIESSIERGQSLAAERTLVNAVAAFGTVLFQSERASLQRIRARAADLVRRGGEAMRRGQPEQAEAHFLDALSIAIDDAQAKAALASIPVDAPRHMKVLRQGPQAQLEWEAGQAGTRYRVLRRVGAPVTPEDAAVVAELAQATWTDPTPPRGLPVHYGVIAIRRGVESVLAMAGVVLVPDMPLDFTALPGDGQIALAWRLPRGATGVELRSNRPEDAGRCWHPAGDTFVHEGLRNGEPVGYTLVALFVDPAGGALPSAAARASATPSVQLEPIRSLTASRHGRSVVFSWPPPPVGRAEIRLLRSPLSHPLGTRVSAAELAALGKPVPLESLTPGGGSADLGAFVGEVARVVIMNVDTGSATVGATADLLMLEPVRDVTTRVSGRYIVLQWEWPALGERVDVAWRFDRVPESPTDPLAIVRQVSRADYLREGVFRIPAEEERLHHIALWVRGTAPGAWSDGVATRNSMGAAAEIRYRVRRRAFGGRRTIELDGPVGAVLKNVEIYGRETSPPVARSDGVLIARASTLALPTGRAEIDASHGVAGHYVKVFCDEPDAYRMTSADKGGSCL